MSGYQKASDYIDKRREIWEPWAKFSDKPTRLPIDGPPCAQCKHWYPVQLIGTHHQQASSKGVRCCHAESMHSDFSCFDIERPE